MPWTIRHGRAVAALAGAVVACVVPAASAAGPLDGMTVALDPGHNGGNAGAPSSINRLVPIGNGRRKACDTTGGQHAQRSRRAADAARDVPPERRARDRRRHRARPAALTSGTVASVIEHVAIEVCEADAERCVRFWALLGFERVDPPAALAARAAWVQAGATTVHLLFADEPVVPSDGHVAVVVADYDNTLAALREAGFQPAPRTAYWGSPRAFVRSPAGHRVEVMAFGPGGAP